MPKLPVLNGGSTTREVIDTFAGYNHNLKINDGEFFFTENLTTQYYPLMANRGKRGDLVLRPEEYHNNRAYQVGAFCLNDTIEGKKIFRCKTAIAFPGEAWNATHWERKDTVFDNAQAIISKTAYPRVPYYVANGCLYGDYGPNPANADVTPLMTGLQTAKPTQLVSMGAYICIFPDKMYFNTEDPSDKGRMDANWSFYGTGVKYKMCHQDGTEFASVEKGSTEPVSPSAGDVWIDETDGSAKEYSSSGTWVVLDSVYTKVELGSAPGSLAGLFKEYDGVEISGLHFDELNGSKIIYGVTGDTNTGDSIILVGVLEENYTDSGNEDIRIKRIVPDMDFVCEAQNRLWGCRYGRDSNTGEMYNEILCCALGDFKNWSQYLGLSTDSWRASRGSDGPFTGCVNYFGAPTFFKENVIHTVSVSSVGAHQISDIPGRGVQAGSHRSLAVVNETLFYKADTGVMAYQGGMPVSVSDALGSVHYESAVAGAIGTRYYISMYGEGAWNLFCYDAAKGLWMREDDLQVQDFAQIGEELYMLSNDHIYTLHGTRSRMESILHWIAETGIQHYQYPDKKYVSRYNIRLQMAAGSTAQLYIEYDSKGPWIFMGNIEAGDIMTDNTGTANVPVRPRRCDHLRLRLEGTGDVRVLSITRVLQKGSDV